MMTIPLVRLAKDYPPLHPPARTRCRLCHQQRFVPGLIICESDWPGVTDVTDNPDGSCILTLRVNHTLEMIPWIRGWGPDCEVLEPEALRQQIAADM